MQDFCARRHRYYVVVFPCSLFVKETRQNNEGHKEILCRKALSSISRYNLCSPLLFPLFFSSSVTNNTMPRFFNYLCKLSSSLSRDFTEIFSWKLFTERAAGHKGKTALNSSSFVSLKKTKKKNFQDFQGTI